MFAQYLLETFTERRAAGWKTVPYTGASLTRPCTRITTPQAMRWMDLLTVLRPIHGQCTWPPRQCSRSDCII